VDHPAADRDHGQDIRTNRVADHEKFVRKYATAIRQVQRFLIRFTVVFADGKRSSLELISTSVLIEAE
jgi:hypothetical protein